MQEAGTIKMQSRSTKKALPFNPGRHGCQAKSRSVLQQSRCAVDSIPPLGKRRLNAYQQACQLMPDLASVKSNLTDLYWKRGEHTS